MENSTFQQFSLSNEIEKALDVLKYTEPTDVQNEVIPRALENQDLIVHSQTGSGKTAAFAIPICEKVAWEDNSPQALVLAPTRELAAQVREDITNIGRFKRIKALALYGREPFTFQKEELKQKTHVVVGTPGRIMDHIRQGTLQLDQVKYLVIDEADEMLKMGFIDEVEAIIQQVPSERVTMLYSATIPQAIEQLCEQYMDNPSKIKIKTEMTTKMIQHDLYEVKQSEKLSLLKDVTTVENPDSCIIFCNTQEHVDEVSTELQESGYTCEQIHGGLEQDRRFSVMEGFKTGQFRYLVATDVAARGIDVDNVSLVINFDVPIKKDSYVHRTGRTGRAGKQGQAITFADRYEEKYVASIERYIGFVIERKEAPSTKEVSELKPAFMEKMAAPRIVKNNKTARINQDIMKLHFNGGKKKKIRAMDLVGTISNIPNVTADDIGIITIKDNWSYVDILNGKGSLVLEAMEHTTVKGKKLKVSKAVK
ncbi:DEAD/DEAH box helicase [Gracilibacillus caseinilyticus]|uniref:ATP-dependent RNA helicase DbpA n=1 Tax=Gracilibacillus caseinilyticus TaxID=2932256 RepID=A0ABY4EYA8_9BACI|nr:DEAD/DEAH box helicase [Gracilibacillus caseinilyticus]UOQ48950.1 DEAD/DEAH box helicase [Gracilibacillus caseinilyticus]